MDGRMPGRKEGDGDREGLVPTHGDRLSDRLVVTGGDGGVSGGTAVHGDDGHLAQAVAGRGVGHCALDVRLRGPDCTLPGSLSRRVDEDLVLAVGLAE